MATSALLLSTSPLWIGTARVPERLAKAGFAVHREYYINDSGAQVDMLARSAHLRYREALGEKVGPQA